jgi:ferritin-like metal-binding protein YciE
MGLFTKDIVTLDDLFVHTLRDIYYAENRILKSLPQLIAKATDRHLKKALTDHCEETEEHIRRLERVFDLHGAEATGIDCSAIDGILDEADELLDEVDDKQVLDAAIVSAAQAVEHYEITRYGTLATWARQLGRDDCAAILVATLHEEKRADELLTHVATSRVNAEAA